MMKIVLFTNKSTIPALFKVLSKEFKDKISMGVAFKNQKALQEAFDANSLPQLFLLTSNDMKTGDFYTGKLKRDPISKWIRSYIQKGKRASVKPNAGKALFFTESLYLKQGLCGPKDRQYCLLMVMDDSTSSTGEAQAEMLQKVA